MITLDGVVGVGGLCETFEKEAADDVLCDSPIEAPISETDRPPIRFSLPLGLTSCSVLTHDRWWDASRDIVPVAKPD
eukprot:906088-Pyramimonas_sp.AAC.2